MIARIVELFTAHYGYPPTHVSRAPGRVNIIGEHTDYNDGFVLPAAIDRAIYIAGKLRDDDQVTIQSLDFGGVTTFTLDGLRDPALPGWSSYPRGALWVLREGGHPVRGMDLTIAGDVPLGAGFSSSAAVEVAMFEIASALLGLSFSQRQKALLGVEVEHRFIGIPSGNMDQMIAALGETDRALLIDCRSLEATPIPVPPGITLLTLDTGVRRELKTSEYGLRRAQCEEAARRLGVASLRDLTPEILAARLDKLPEVFRKRALHVVHENARTLAVVNALKAGDLCTVGYLINEGHTSLSQLYQVSIPELDVMADLAQHEEGCYGARMMGGGFGGAVIALVADEAAARISEAVARGYKAATGRDATVYAAKIGPGSSVTRL